LGSGESLESGGARTEVLVEDLGSGGVGIEVDRSGSGGIAADSDYIGVVERVIDELARYLRGGGGKGARASPAAS
jgi:hypothetical protein